MSTSATQPFPSPNTHHTALSPTTSITSTSSNPTSPPTHTTSTTTTRPKLLTRKSSGSLIISRDSPTALASPHSHLHDDDATGSGAMSPRRNSEEVDELGESARRDMFEQARQLQKSLEAIVDRVEAVKSEHEKLEGGNKFLQSYIGELMQTSRITSSQPIKGKSKGRSGK